MLHMLDNLVNVDKERPRRHCRGMAREPELTERVVVLLAPDMIVAIDRYRKRGEVIPSRGEAIRQLLWKGLKAVEELDKPKV